MSTDTYFPVKFLTIGNEVGEGTTTGLYMRWFVQPYLGIVGISPLHPEQIPDHHHGFRLFYHIESGAEQPKLNPLPLDPVLPKDPEVRISDVWERPSWKATCHPAGERTHLRLDLVTHYQYDICYLRFNYTVYQGQTLKLQYAVHSSSTGATTHHEVPLHYADLVEDLDEEDSEDLTYAIHVDNPDESITEVTFITDGSLMVGDFYYADRGHLPFYIWSPEGDADHWMEIPAEKYAIEVSPEALITTVTEGEMLGALKAFYESYYNLQPHQSDNNQITFRYPLTPQFQLTPPLTRDYFADQYEAFLKGKYESEDVDFYIPPQDAAALATNDPAIAYLFGLFRVLRWDGETQEERIYKLQGTWPDGKRFCIYSHFSPALELVRPKISNLAAAPTTEDRVIYDYATFRNHHPLRTCDLSWEVPPAPSPPQGPDIWLDPAAYLVLRQKSGEQVLTCLSPFYIPREEDCDNHRTHYLDWYDQYRETDINKVLDGKYRYHLAGCGIFGQMSDWQDTDRQTDPLPLHMGAVQKPRITLVDPQDEPIEIPLVVAKTQTGYQLKEFSSEQVRFEISFFWPLESRYLWEKNRATGKASLDYFKLFYMTDTLLFSPVVFRIQSNTAAGIQVELAQVSLSGSNSHLFNLLIKLGAVDSNGQLIPAGVDLVLLGGSLYFGRQFDITQVTVTPASATVDLTLLPADGTKKDSIEQSGYVLPESITELTSEPINGRLYWNQEATYTGGYVGWKTLSFAGEKIQPTPLLDFNEALVSENKAPNTASGPPPDLQPDVGLEAFEPPQAEGDYGFVIRLPASHPLCNYERFQFVPLDPASGRAPGEHLRADLSTEEQTAIPTSAAVLFTQERIFAFYASRIGGDPQEPGKVLFRGDPLSFVSRSGNVEKEYIIFPDTGHTNWRVIVPNVITKQVPLAEFLAGKTFNQDHYLTTSLSVGVEAVASGQDTEVKDSLQSAVAIKKLSFQEFLQPPVLKIPDKPQPAFGIPASPPGYDGNSLISVKKIFTGYDLENQLTTGRLYLLYRLPAGRIRPEGFPVKYAKVPSTADTYQRNMLDLKQKLDGLKSQAGGVANYLDAEQIQKCFQDYAEKVEQQPLDKQSFLRLPVTLPGESQTVYLFAIKAYDQNSSKESTAFTCLSKPVYVEDPTKPETPYIKSMDITRQGNNMSFKFAVSRKLNAVDGYGYASAANLANHPDLLGSYFPYFIARYRVYACNRPKIAASPDESDFVPALSGATPVGGSGKRFCVKLLHQALAVSEVDTTTVKVTGSVTFSSSVDLENMPAQLCICLRAGNYLGEWSPLKFLPVTYREG